MNRETLERRALLALWGDFSNAVQLPCFAGILLCHHTAFSTPFRQRAAEAILLAAGDRPRAALDLRGDPTGAEVLRRSTTPAAEAIQAADALWRMVQPKTAKRQPDRATAAFCPQI